MIPSATEPIAWSPRRQWVCIGLLFAAQIWAVHHFDRRPRLPPSGRPAPPLDEPSKSWVLLPDPLGGDELASSLLADDPALFALPNPRGFSGPLWAAPGPVEYRPADWSDPPRFLSLDAASLGQALSVDARYQGFPPFDLFGEAEPSSEALGLYPPPETPETNSVLILGGELAGRGLGNPPALSAWPSAEIVSNSTVRVTVNSAGAVLSSVLIGRSGRPEADASALRLARQLRFFPLNNDGRANEAEAGPVSWGDLVFSWAMLPATNAAPAKAGFAP
jgi:TonB family protein